MMAARIFSSLVASALAACATVSVQVPAPAPVPAERQAGIAAANPLAVEADRNPAAGGSPPCGGAVRQCSVIRAQSSGVGGRRILLYYDAASKTHDGLRRTRGGAACATHSCSSMRTARLSYRDAVVSGRSTACWCAGDPASCRAAGRLRASGEAGGARGGWRLRAAALARSRTARTAGHQRTCAALSRADGTPVQAGDLNRNPPSPRRCGAREAGTAFDPGVAARDAYRRRGGSARRHASSRDRAHQRARRTGAGRSRLGVACRRRTPRASRCAVGGELEEKELGLQGDVRGRFCSPTRAG